MNRNELTRVSWYSHLLVVVTSIHHVYGARIYQTPWRLHILLISIPVIILTALLERHLLKKGYSLRSIAFWLYWTITLIASIGLIGLFEGVYNHLAKDVLFYAGANRHFLLQLFPPPTYEMPNDFWFETTGVTQAFLVVPLIISFVRLSRNRWQGERIVTL